MLKALIVEDETKARRVLEELLKEYCPTVRVVAAVENVAEGVKAINALHPDIVFLDIEMPEYNGFQLFNFIDKVNFEVIFTTAYQEYALQAFEVAAIGYLLKPIQIEKLVQVIEKVTEKLKQQANERIELLKNVWQKEKMSKIALPVSDGFLFIELNDIMYLIAEGSYTNIILRDNRRFMISKNIKNFEDLFTSNLFFRPHRSYLINLNAVKQFIKQDGGYILMENGDAVSIAKEKKEDFLKAYQLLK